MARISERQLSIVQFCKCSIAVFTAVETLSTPVQVNKKCTPFFAKTGNPLLLARLVGTSVILSLIIPFSFTVVEFGFLK